jgi:hypothetical protein
LIHLEKPIREIFTDICDDKLTNLEIDAFIKKTTNKFKLPILKRLIIDFERFIQKERAELLIYFEFMYGDRKKFVKNGEIADVEALNKIIEGYVKRYKDAPEINHSDYDSGSQEIIDFSPFLNEFSTEKTKHEYYKSLSIQTISSGITAGATAFGIGGGLLWSILPSIMSTYALSRMNSPRFTKTVGKLGRDLNTEDSDIKSDFTIGLQQFLDSPVYHFHVKLHTLFNLLKKHPYQNQNVSEPSTPYKPNSPEKYFSPKKCAQLFKKDKTTPYTEQDITFVMEQAEKCDYDNIENLIREIREHPECPDMIKDNNKDSKAERRWINYYYEKNKIPKGEWKKKFSSTSEN